LGAVRPLPAYEESALAIGHANILPDEDGIVRRLPVIIRNGSSYDPALSLSAVAKYLRRPGIISPSADNQMSCGQDDSTG
jgi:CHASE2 domain-containing sensor protein